MNPEELSQRSSESGEGFRIAVLNTPLGYIQRLGEPRSVSIGQVLPGHQLDLIHFFAAERKGLETEFPRLKKGLTRKGTLWVSWPKRSSGVKTDLNDRVVREIGLSNGLVDVKVAAIDETWSGLKFVHRTNQRQRTPKPDNP